MYIYSIPAALLFYHLLTHPSPFSSLVLAWSLLVDTIISLIYTSLFTTSYLSVIARTAEGELADSIDSNAGFTSPSKTVSSVIIAPTGVPGVPVLEHPSSEVIMGSQTPSMIILALILLMKLFFVLVVFSHARQQDHERTKGWRRKVSDFLTRGSYWRDDMRLGKHRSVGRDG